MPGAGLEIFLPNRIGRKILVAFHFDRLIAFGDDGALPHCLGHSACLDSLITRSLHKTSHPRMRNPDRQGAVDSIRGKKNSPAKQRVHTSKIYVHRTRARGPEERNKPEWKDQLSNACLLYLTSIPPCEPITLALMQ
jgi:hypothetical protein